MAEGAKPSIAALLVGKLGAKSSADEEAAEDNGAEMCAKDIIDAIHSKDHKALASALKDFDAFADEDEGGSESGQPGDAGAAARDPNRGYSAFKK